jgi:general secretion pathway protein I
MRTDPTAEAGFTLIEVLVAFVIAIVALSVMVHAAVDGLRGATMSGRYQEAMARARSHLAAVGDAPAASDRQGDEGDGFHWHVRIAPITTAALAQHGQATLLAVSVAISWAGRSVQLDSERLVAGGVAEAP